MEKENGCERLMPLEFVDDAICLSGEMGTKLKSEIIGEYYKFWWNVVSGGESNSNILHTAIIEMDAAAGKAYIKETDEFVLGSAGHALELKCSDDYKTRNLTLFLIEIDKGCFDRLLRNITKICSNIPKNIGDSQHIQNKFQIFLSNNEAEEAIIKLDSIKELGNSLFFFDPLLCVEWELVEKVARRRITKPYKKGTEFILFNFTSDWFLGRGDFHPLPKTIEEKKWTNDEKNTVKLGNSFFGDDYWKDQLLYDGKIEERQERMITLYKNRLNKWFRFVLPLPFSPKENQLYHLFLCSNYEVGINVAKNFYATKTNNPIYQPNNQKTYDIFRKKYPNLKLKHRERRPKEWKALWSIIKLCEGGIVDKYCRTLFNVNLEENELALDFLMREDFLLVYDNINWPWDEVEEYNRYKINWEKIKKDFDVDPPEKLKPLLPNQVQ